MSTDKFVEKGSLGYKKVITRNLLLSAFDAFWQLFVPRIEINLSRWIFYEGNTAITLSDTTCESFLWNTNRIYYFNWSHWLSAIKEVFCCQSSLIIVYNIRDRNTLQALLKKPHLKVSNFCICVWSPKTCDIFRRRYNDISRLSFRNTRKWGLTPQRKKNDPIKNLSFIFMSSINEHIFCCSFYSCNPKNRSSQSDRDILAAKYTYVEIVFATTLNPICN